MPTTGRNKDAEKYYAKGYAARKCGNFEEAVSFYTKALEIQPAHFKALFNRAFAYDKLK
jgi:tetratricopeptide (TPR) repeat protein